MGSVGFLLLFCLNLFVDVALVFAVDALYVRGCSCVDLGSHGSFVLALIIRRPMWFYSERSIYVCVLIRVSIFGIPPIVFV